MNRTLRIALAAAGVLVLAGAGGAYAYYFSGLRTAPAPLALSSPSPAPSASAPPSAGLAGAWKVVAGSEAGFRVGEVFAGQGARHEAVVRTTTVSGNLNAAGAPSGYTLSAVSVTVSAADLKSVDTVAGFNVAQRDRIIAGQLASTQFPNATFTAGGATIPAAVESSQVTVSLPGKLTIHGVTRDVTASVQAQKTATGIEAVGSIPIVMTDYGVQPPRLPITTVESNVTIEFKLELSKAPS